MAKEKENLHLIIYVGTRRLAGLLAKVSPALGGEGEGKEAGSVRVLGLGEIPNAEGFQKGEAVQLEKALVSVETLLKQLSLGEEASDLPTYVLTSGPHLKMHRFTSSTYYPGYPRVVTSREVRQVIEQTRSVAPLPLEDWALQVIPESFCVNDLAGVEDPVGLEAQRLAVTLDIFTTRYASFRNLARLFETLEFNLRGYFPKTLVLPEAVLNASEREGESLVIDFSDEATHLILTRDGKIVQTRSLDLGSRFLTAKVAEAWGLGIRDAERLKERFGSLEKSSENGQELIPLLEREGHEKHQIKRAEFHQTFLGFGEELLSKIEKELKGFLAEEKAAHPRLILTGGGAKLEGLLERLTERLGTPVRLGIPRQVAGVSQRVTDPAWSGCVGLLHWIAANGNGLITKQSPFSRSLVQVREWLTAYF